MCAVSPFRSSEFYCGHKLWPNSETARGSTAIQRSIKNWYYRRIRVRCRLGKFACPRYSTIGRVKSERMALMDRERLRIPALNILSDNLEIVFDRQLATVVEKQRRHKLDGTTRNICRLADLRAHKIEIGTLTSLGPICLHCFPPLPCNEQQR